MTISADTPFKRVRDGYDPVGTAHYYPSGGPLLDRIRVTVTNGGLTPARWSMYERSPEGFLSDRVIARGQIPLKPRGDWPSQSEIESIVAEHSDL